MSDKYTLGEAAAVGGIGAVAIAVLGALSGLFAIVLVAAYTWVDLHVYNWFAVPYLRAPHLALLPAVGITMLVRVILCVESKPVLKPECLDASKNKLLWIGVPFMHLMTWGTAAVVHWMIGKGW